MFGGLWTLDLRIISQVFNQCATNKQPIIGLSLSFGVWHRLNFRHIHSSMIQIDTRYWQSDTKTVKFQEITIRNQIIKILFEPSWYLAILNDTWWYYWYQQYLTKICYILQIYLTVLILFNTWHYLHDTNWYLTYILQY
jgi:hypothetical protein